MRVLAPFMFVVVGKLQLGCAAISRPFHHQQQELHLRTLIALERERDGQEQQHKLCSLYPTVAAATRNRCPSLSAGPFLEFFLSSNGI